MVKRIYDKLWLYFNKKSCERLSKKINNWIIFMKEINDIKEREEKNGKKES